MNDNHFFKSFFEAIKLVERKTLPHLMYFGRWTSFVIKIPRGRFELYYEGSTNPLFHWEHPEPAKAFMPIYYYYTSESGNAIGIAFDCDTSTKKITRTLIRQINCKFDSRVSHRAHKDKQVQQNSTGYTVEQRGGTITRQISFDDASQRRDFYSIVSASWCF